MYINKYDIVIDSEIDKLYSKIVKNIKIDVFLKELVEIKKNINNSVFKNLVSNIDEKDTDLYFEISRKILSNYLVCLLFAYNKSKINIIKTEIIKLNIYKSEDLGTLFSLSNDFFDLKRVVNEQNRELLVKEYETNIKTKNAIDLLNNLGFEFVESELKGDKDINTHKLTKIIIQKNYYQKIYRKDIFNIISSNRNISYEYIDIIKPQIKVIDFNNIESTLKTNEKKTNLTQDIFDFISNYEKRNLIDYSVDDFINILLERKIIIPIMDDFLRYHKITEKYERNTSTKINQYEKDNKKDQTKIRYIISKTDKIKDYYSKKIQNNSTLKKEVEKQFYRPLEYRKAIIINEIEELSIINKLRKQGKTAMDSNEFFYDLINLRKSAYVNFKDFKNYGFNFLTSESVTGIRYSLIEALEEKKVNSTNILLETRVLGKNTRSNIVGFAVVKDKLETLKLKDIKNIRTSKEDNCYEKFLNKLNDSLDDKLDQNYYWIFDPNTDNKKTEYYERNDITDPTKSDYIRLLIKHLHNDFLVGLYNKIYKEINKYDKLYLYNSYQFIDFYQKKFIDTNKLIDGVNYKNKLLNFIHSKMPIIDESETYDDDEDIVYGFSKNSIKLPIFKSKIKNIPTIVLKDNIESKNEENKSYENAICQHNIDWMFLSKIKNTDPNKHTLLLYNYVEKYVMQNNENEYICKSCKQLLDIQNYLSNTFDGGSEGFDIVLSSTRPLEEIYEYSKFKIGIKMMDKYIERIAQITNFSYFVGDNTINKFRRQEIVKITIDLITIHDETLRTTNLNKRDRERLAATNYGISPDYSNYFIFPLSNDIFKYSSQDVDKFKKIKLNNILIYNIFLMILELNTTQIMNIEFDKNCNLFLFNKFGIKLFDNLYIRLDTSNNAVKISTYESLCLVIFYFSCMISKYKLWYHPLAENKDFNTVNIQKDIIHTMIDMINSIMEVYANEEKDYLYKILGSRFSNRLINIYSNKEILEFIQDRENKKIIIDTNTNKIKFSKSKIKPILLDGTISQYEDKIISKNRCFPNTYYISAKLKERDSNKILGKELDKIRENYNIENMRKLAMLYDKNGSQLKNRLSYNEVSKFSEDKLKDIVKNFNFIKVQKEINKNDIILDKINKSYLAIKNNNKNEDNIDKIIELIKNSIGETVKIRSVVYNLENSQLLIDHDYLGNSISNNIYIFDNDKKVKIRFNNELNLKVYEIIDRSNDITLFYNYSNFHFLGYKEANRNFVNMKSLSKYLKFIPSIRNLLKTLGFKRYNYNIQNNAIFQSVIRNASNNLKNYIRQIETGFNQIRYKINNISINNVVLYYQKKISNINIRGSKGKIFHNWDNFLKLQKVKFQKIKESLNNIPNEELSNMSESYNELLSYLYSQILLVIEYNNEKFLKSNIIFFFISYLIYLYYLNFEQHPDFEMIKFDYILELYEDFTNNTESLYTDEERENLSDEQKEQIKEEKIDDDEWANSLDVDMEGTGDEDDEQVLFENLDISGRTSIF